MTYEKAVEATKAGTLLDGPRVLDIIVPIGYDDSRYPTNDADGVIYTCRVWDPRTRRCTEYDQRPPMCSNYPYGRDCEWCTFDPANPAAAVTMRPLVEIFSRYPNRRHSLEDGIFDPGLLEIVLLGDAA